MFSKKLLSGAALTALSFATGAGAAYAQSTATQAVEEEAIVVTGVRRDVNGAITAEQAAKARSTVTADLIDQQTAGQTILNTINLVPGVSFTNNDPFGSSGGNIRMRGFDGARISLTFDGVPLNDTGNYAIFSNQMLDPELISRASVNMGTTDVDSPTASATGGTINYVTVIPDEEFGLRVQPSVGDFGYWRLFGRLDTGAIGDWGTRTFAAASFQEYDQFVGPGELEKQQYNVRLYQPLSGDDFMSLSFHWNENRNHFYRQGSFAEWAANPELQNFDTCALDAPTPGVADNDGFGNASNEADPAGCTNYYNLRINPSNTGNLRGQSRFSLGENLTFTFDPIVQYVLANGGGTTVVRETDDRLDLAGGNLAGPGVDLNGDGDVLDQVRLYSPSNTNTIRYNVLSSMIWDINPAHRMIFGFTYDTGRHRQTGEYGLLDANGDPRDVFGGKDGEGGAPILTLAGTVFQKRNRLSIATLEQFSLRYLGNFMDDALTLDVGLRAPRFTRDLDQRCFTSAGNAGDPTCASGGFVPPGVAPFQASVEYEDVLPSLGVVYRPADGHQTYFSYAEGLSAPRTDDLYNGLTPDQLDEVDPETSQAYDIGYRYQGDRLILSTQGWYNMFQNRIVRVFDQDQGINISRNIGDVDLWGGELEVGYRFTDSLSAYVSTAYIGSEVQGDLQTGVDADGPDNILGNADDNAPIFAATAGKELVETPDWTLATRVEYETGPFTIGLQGKYVGDRWATDVNDQVAPSYTVFDLDLRWDFGQALGNESTYLQLNVINLFDEDYFGSFFSQVATSGPGAGTVRYNLGAPRTWMLSLRTQF